MTTISFIDFINKNSHAESRNSVPRFAFLIGFLLFIAISKSVSAQVTDTISNWEGINVEWTIVCSGGETVLNTEQQGINPSSYCMEISTSENPYDLVFTDFSTPVNFAEFPFYRLKVRAPQSGGSILLKFENSDNSSSKEIEKIPMPGVWDELEFDFSGTTASDFTRMVVFFDFLGTTPDQSWLLDDVIRNSEGSGGLTSNLPIIIINTNGVEIPDEPKITGNMGIIDNGPGNLNNQYDTPNDYDGYIGIEIRGQSSQMFPKKSYGVETRESDGENRDVSLLGMPEENDWVLYAPYTDKSMLRNFITFYMGSKLSIYCSRMAYCEVIVNGDYRGVYILMEKIKKNEHRVDIAKLKSDDIAGDELTGGYIVKVDKIDPGFTYGIDGWKSIPSPAYPNAMNITFQYNYPKVDDIVQIQRNYIKDYITTAENTLTSTVFADPNAGYNQYFNTGSFVDQMILNEVSKEVDAYRYSTYFYKRKESDGGKLFAGPAWDFNLGYANVDYWPEGVDYAGWMYPIVESHDYGIMFWWKRLMEDAYYKDLFYTRWRQLRQNEFSKSKLEHAIDSIVTYIDEAQQRNYERWPILGEYVWPNYDWKDNDYQDEVTFFETWFFNRVFWIDYNISGSTLTPTAELSSFYPELKITLDDEYFSQPILDNEYFTLNNAPSGMAIESVSYVNASQAIVNLSGDIIGNEQLSITIHSKVLNGYTNITTNEWALGNDFTPYVKPEVLVYTDQNSIHIRCRHPELLGDHMYIYNLWGQRVKTNSLDKTSLNRTEAFLKPGIYLCSFVFDGKLQSHRIVFSH